MGRPLTCYVKIAKQLLMKPALEGELFILKTSMGCPGKTKTGVDFRPSGGHNDFERNNDLLSTRNMGPWEQGDYGTWTNDFPTQ